MKIKELLSDPSKWTQGKIARDSSMNEIHPNDPQAVCWCLIGAVRKCYPGHYDYENLCKRIVEQTKEEFLFNWNDSPTTTFSDVKSLVEELDI